MVRRAHDLYHGTAYAQLLSMLTRQRGEPLRIALVGPSPAVVDHVRKLLDGELRGPDPPGDRARWAGRRSSAPRRRRSSYRSAARTPRLRIHRSLR
jgi:hypothetical protein